MLESKNLSVIIRNYSKNDKDIGLVDQLRDFFINENLNGEILILNENGLIEHILHNGLIKPNNQSVDTKTPALLRAINQTKGRFIAIIDNKAFNNINIVKSFYNELLNGCDIVIANNINEKKKKHSYFSKLSIRIEKSFFSSQIDDFFATNRAFSRIALQKLDLQTKGYEFLSEMVIKAHLMKLNIKSIDIKVESTENPTDRKMANFFQYFFLLLLYSPNWLFFYPGIILLILGTSLDLFVLIMRNIHIDIHTMLFSASMIIVGFQMLVFSIYSKLFAYKEKLIPSNAFINKIFKRFSLEKGIITGGILLCIGILIGLYNVFIWEQGTFFDLGIRITFSYTIQSIIFIVIGFNLIISSFFLNFLAINRRK